jgi:uncharacterized protein YlaI
VEVTCIICGKKEELSKLHKEYESLREKQNAAYICEMCNHKLSSEASSKNEIKKGAL